jgi:hypothetical protein
MFKRQPGNVAHFRLLSCWIGSEVCNSLGRKVHFGGHFRPEVLPFVRNERYHILESSNFRILWTFFRLYIWRNHKSSFRIDSVGLKCFFGSLLLPTRGEKWTKVFSLTRWKESFTLPKGPIRDPEKSLSYWGFNRKVKDMSAKNEIANTINCSDFIKLNEKHLPNIKWPKFDVHFLKSTSFSE